MKFAGHLSTVRQRRISQRSGGGVCVMVFERWTSWEHVLSSGKNPGLTLMTATKTE